MLFKNEKKTVDIAVLGKSLPLKVTRLDLQKRIHSFFYIEIRILNGIL